jgi:hypothetical protein
VDTLDLLLSNFMDKTLMDGQNKCVKNWCRQCFDNTQCGGDVVLPKGVTPWE